MKVRLIPNGDGYLIVNAKGKVIDTAPTRAVCREMARLRGWVIIRG